MTDMSTTPETDALMRQKPERRPAAFINAIAEEGTKDEAITFLQRQWDEWCQMRDHARSLEARLIAQTELLREAWSLVPGNWGPLDLRQRVNAALSAHPQGAKEV